MKKLIAIVFAALLTVSSLAATPAQDDMVSMVKKGANATHQGSKVVYHRTKVGGKWVYVRGYRAGKSGYKKVKKGGKWVWQKVR